MSTLTITVVIAGLAAAGFLLANVVIARGGARGAARRALKTGNPPVEGRAPKTAVGARSSHLSDHASVSAS